MDTNFERGSSEPEIFLDQARREAQQFRTELVKSGQLVAPDAFCTLLAMPPSELEFGLKENRFFQIEVDGKSYFPSFYFDPGLYRSEIESISKLLAGLNGDVKWQFFNTPKLTLEGFTPLAALAQGRFQDVAFAAGGFASL